MDIINLYTDKIVERLNKDTEEALITFLRKQGYKPRKNLTYIKNLKKKLKKENKEIEIKYNYNTDWLNNKSNIFISIRFIEVNKNEKGI